MQEENLDKSFLLAADIQQNFSQSLKRKNRGVKQAGFVVLHQTYMPSVLIELGFLTNKNEGKFLNSKIGQQKMAKEIARSIHKYHRQLKANTVALASDPPLALLASAIALIFKLTSSLRIIVPISYLVYSLMINSFHAGKYLSLTTSAPASTFVPVPVVPVPAALVPVLLFVLC
mgnify:CR=1 FL=1